MKLLKIDVNIYQTKKYTFGFECTRCEQKCDLNVPARYLYFSLSRSSGSSAADGSPASPRPSGSKSGILLKLIKFLKPVHSVKQFCYTSILQIAYFDMQIDLMCSFSGVSDYAEIIEDDGDYSTPGSKSNIWGIIYLQTLEQYTYMHE